MQPLTKKTLTIKLKELEALELIDRTAFAEVPPRVEYSLTNHGQSLEPVIGLNSMLKVLQILNRIGDIK